VSNDAEAFFDRQYRCMVHGDRDGANVRFFSDVWDEMKK
jgi:hypothetical protein